MTQKKTLTMAISVEQTKRLRIKQCSDSLLWYADLVGKEVPFVREVPEGYLSREPDGYTNIVRREDAEVIEITK